MKLLLFHPHPHSLLSSRVSYVAVTRCAAPLHTDMNTTPEPNLILPLRPPALQPAWCLRSSALAPNLCARMKASVCSAGAGQDPPVYARTLCLTRVDCVRWINA